jgi:hypothetical protein
MAQTGRAAAATPRLVVDCKGMSLPFFVMYLLAPLPAALSNDYP